MEQYILIKITNGREEILAKGSLEEVEQYKLELEEVGRCEEYVTKQLDKNNGFHRMMSSGLHLSRYKDGRVYLQRMIDNAEIYQGKYILSVQSSINCLEDLKDELINVEDNQHINCTIKLLEQKIENIKNTPLDIIL